MFRDKKSLIWAASVFIGSFSVYFNLLMPGIYAGDSGDVVTASYVLGVAHPPGYPLYCLLGNLFSRLPFGPTVAWRYSLFSAFTSSLTLALFFLGLKYLTKRTIPSLVGTFVLAFSYLFWLYSEVQEVFAMSVFFVVVLVFLGLKLSEDFKQKKFNFKLLYIWFFFAGLSLTHHHTVLLLTPAFIYLFWHTRKDFLVKKKTLILSILFFLLGFSFYLYVPWAASKNPPINWNNAINLRNFVRLVSRADYGTFLSAGYINEHFFQRIYQFKLYLKLVLDDFTIVGFFLIFFGIIFCFLKKRMCFWFLILCLLFSGPLFLFYANFPLENYFYLGIFERFLILPNIFLVIFLSFGVYNFGQILKNFFEKFLKKRYTFVSVGEGLFLLLCLLLFWLNFEKVDFRGIKTGSNFAEDLLGTPEKGSVVFLSGDTPLFNSQYKYFAEKYRKDDLILISSSRSGESYIVDYVEKNYPNVYLPQRGEGFLDKFFEANSKNFSIYSNVDFNLESGIWIPVGLLFKYFPDNKKDYSEQISELNDKAWNSYHDYSEKRRSIEASLLLKDIRPFFARGCARIGRYFFDRKEYNMAKGYLEKGLFYDADYPENYMILGMIQFNIRNCSEAEKNYFEYLEKTKEDIDIYFSLATLYKYCFNDEKKAIYYEQIYEKMKKESELKLEGL